MTSSNQSRHLHDSWSLIWRSKPWSSFSEHVLILPNFKIILITAEYLESAVISNVIYTAVILLFKLVCLTSTLRHIFFESAVFLVRLVLRLFWKSARWLSKWLLCSIHRWQTFQLVRKLFTVSNSCNPLRSSVKLFWVMLFKPFIPKLISYCAGTGSKSLVM